MAGDEPSYFLYFCWHPSFNHIPIAPSNTLLKGAGPGTSWLRAVAVTTEPPAVLSPMNQRYREIISSNSSQEVVMHQCATLHTASDSSCNIR